MGMGYGANYADVVEESFVKKICKNELKNFKKEFEVMEEDWMASIELFEMEGYKNIMKDSSNVSYSICKAYDILVKAFKKRTGLGLVLSYHDSSSEGDRYDEVDGYFWSVDGVYTYTKAGKKFSSDIKRKFFVTYG